MKVSIITVTYNSAKTISRTIESVLNQTYTNIDYWIIDGKSSDNTIGIVKSYEKKFKGRLHWISESDKGIYDAMNKGYNNCTGDIIGTLNSDDWLTSDNVIGTIVKTFSRNTIDAVYGNICFVSKENKNKAIYHNFGRIFSPFLLRFGMAPPHPSFYVKKSIVQKYGYYDSEFKIAGDFDFMARLCYKYKIKTKYINLNFVTMTNGGTSTKDEEAFTIGTKEILQSCKRLNIKTNNWMIETRRFFYILANHI